MFYSHYIKQEKKANKLFKVCNSKKKKNIGIESRDSCLFSSQSTLSLQEFINESIIDQVDHGDSSIVLVHTNIFCLILDRILRK